MSNPIDSRDMQEQLWAKSRQIEITEVCKSGVLVYREEGEGKHPRGYTIHYTDSWTLKPDHIYCGLGGALTAVTIYNWIAGRKGGYNK